jgi:hypothetical protein
MARKTPFSGGLRERNQRRSGEQESLFRLFVIKFSSGFGSSCNETMSKSHTTSVTISANYIRIVDSND